MGNTKQTINKVKEIVYVAQGFTTGLTDLVLVVRKPNGTLVAPNPTITEQGLGVYTASYTPDALGTWQEQITSVVNGDKVIRAYDVVSYDTDDLQSQVDGVETKADTIITDIATVNTKVDNIINNSSAGGYFA